MMNRLLGALGEQLDSRDESVSLVVVGGSALIARGLIERATKDVDVVALVGDDGLRPAAPLPEALLDARRVVARDFAISEEWLNAGPSSLVDFGLPEGLVDRCEPRHYGRGLTVLFIARDDQIHLKLYATVDQGAGKHLDDLQALAPTPAELMAAARWSRTHDPSEGYRAILVEVLDHFGVSGAQRDL